jgi:hypothetical protein
MLQYRYSNKKVLAPSSIITQYKHNNFSHGEYICQKTSMLKKRKAIKPIIHGWTQHKGKL